MNRIELSFDKSQTRLAGFPFGVTTYNDQVKKRIDINTKEKIIIVFPNQIEKVASSFVQGFFSELINTIGYEKIEDRFIVESSSDKVTNKILNNIY